MKSYVFSFAMLLLAASHAHACLPGLPAVEPDSTAAQADSSVTSACLSDTVACSRYDRRVTNYRRMWNFLIPTQFIVQYAGNMGVVSAGVGWNYGSRRQYETNLLFGYLPKFETERSKLTMTLKQNYIPWRIAIGSNFNAEPLSCGLYLNTVFGHEFWGREPRRYPDKYYQFLSTKVRVNAFVGQRITAVVPENRRKFVKNITVFYEVSTCDLYVRAMVQDGTVSLWDILSLSLGLKVQLL